MGMELREFTVIVGDLVHSRNIAGREQVSQKIRLAIECICSEFRGEFYAPLVLTRGIDEFSGVLNRPDMSYRICRFLNDKIYPCRFRYAVVQGKLDIEVESRNAGRMDGPAFHVASDMISRAQREKLHCIFKLGLPAEYDVWLSELANVVELLRADWSERKRHIVRLYEKMEPRAGMGRQNEVARILGVSQQSVSSTLLQAKWKEINRVENVIDKALHAVF